MGCVATKLSGVEDGSSLVKQRFGDKLYERRDRCVELFCKSVLKRIDDSLSKWSTRRQIKAAYDDGIFHLFVIEATPTTRLFLDRSIVRERLELTDESPVKPAVNIAAPRRVELLQYDQTEEYLTKPVSQLYAFGVYLQPIEHSSAYGVWISWHRQHPGAAKPDTSQPRKLRLNDGLLNSTISIGTLPREGH